MSLCTGTSFLPASLPESSKGGQGHKTGIKSPACLPPCGCAVGVQAGSLMARGDRDQVSKMQPSLGHSVGGTVDPLTPTPNLLS